MKLKKIFIAAAYIFISLLGIELFAQQANYWESIPEKIKNTNSFKRYEWFYRPRTDKNGRIPLEHISQQKLNEKQKIASQKKSKFYEVTGTSDLWTNIGPKAIDMSSSFVSHWGTVSGRIRGLAIHPTNPDIVYIGAAAGGIWKTTNGGTSWDDISGDFNTLTFGAIAIDPNNPNTVYVGTGEAIYSSTRTTFEGNGLYKSTDGGSNWAKISDASWTITQFSDIAVSPHNSNHILVSMASGNFNLGTNPNAGVWLTTDGGSNWSEVLTHDQAFDVAFHPSNSNLAYAVIGGEDANSGFYTSNNSGATFTNSAIGLPATSTMGRMQFDQSVTDPNTMFMLIYDPDGGFASSRQTAAYKTTDGGSNWFQISSGSRISGWNGSSTADQGYYDQCLAISPTDEDLVFFGNTELSKTIDGSIIDFVRNPAGPYGGTQYWDCPTHVDIHKIAFAPSNANYIYVGCDGGIFRSTNGGTDWSSLNNNINTVQFYRIASHPTDANIIFGGAQDNGNFRTTDKGSTDWDFLTTGDGMECVIYQSDPNYVLVSTQYGRVYQSTDGGSTFSSKLSSASNTAWTAPLWQRPGSNNFYIASNKKIWSSGNKGSSWSAWTSSSVSSTISHAAPSPVTTGNLMIACSEWTSTPNIYTSTLWGFNFDDKTSNYNSSVTSDASILRIVADLDDGSTFYLCRASYSTGQVMKTTDFGDTWVDVFDGLPNIPTNDLFFDPSNTNHIYAANDFGVYWSSNGGTDWTKLSNGMPFVPALDFDFFDNGTNRYLRIATHGRGVYELSIDTPLPVELILFTGELIDSNTVLLEWKTATEVNNYGFEVERKKLEPRRNLFGTAQPPIIIGKH